MRTIYLISRAKAGTGPVNQALNILLGMKKNGRVLSTLVTLAPEKQGRSWLNRFKENGIDIMQFNQPLWRTGLCVLQLKQYVKENKVDIIHACGYRANIVALLTTTSAKKVITQRCHPKEIVEKFPSFLQPIFSYMYMKIIRQMDTIVACSKSIQSIFKKEYNMSVECVQNGVNSDFFKPTSDSEKFTLRKELGLPLDKKIYLILGSLRERKNNALILDAIKQINNKSFVIVVVGSGPEEDILKQKANEDKRIIFKGVTKAPIEYLQAADILLSASLAEGLPNTVLEALACGLPCVLSDIEPHKELIEGTGAGTLFKNNNIGSFIKAFADSLEWNTNEMIHKAREAVMANFDIVTLATRYENIYRKTLGEDS